MVRQYNLQYVLWKLLSFQQNKKNILHWKCIFREAVRSKHRKFLTKVALSKEILLTSSLVQVFFFFFKKKKLFCPCYAGFYCDDELFWGIVDRRKVLSFIFSWTLCQRFSLSQISNTP